MGDFPVVWSLGHCGFFLLALYFHQLSTPIGNRAKKFGLGNQLGLPQVLVGILQSPCFPDFISFCFRFVGGPLLLPLIAIAAQVDFVLGVWWFVPLMVGSACYWIMAECTVYFYFFFSVNCVRGP